MDNDFHPIIYFISNKKIVCTITIFNPEKVRMLMLKKEKDFMPASNLLAQVIDHQTTLYHASSVLFGLDQPLRVLQLLRKKS